MSSAAHAYVLFGLPLEFIFENYTAMLTRYDPKSGRPSAISSTAFHIDVKCGTESQRLPEDDEAFSESDDTWNNWRRRRGDTRIHHWATSLGLCSEATYPEDIVYLERRREEQLQTAGVYIRGIKVQVILGRELAGVSSTSCDSCCKFEPPGNDAYSRLQQELEQKLGSLYCDQPLGLFVFAVMD